MENTFLSVNLLAVVACIFMFIGSTSGQQSPCPHVFSYKVDPNTNQAFGYIELNNLRISKSVRLIVALSYNASVGKEHMGSIRPIKSSRQTIRDIYNNLPAQYRVNFPLADVLPIVLTISVNGQMICSGQPAQGSTGETVKLEHVLFTQVQQAANTNIGSGVNVLPEMANGIQPQAIPSLADTENICGTVSSWFSSSSNKGVIATKGQFPWLAPIFIADGFTKPQYHHGSTLITAQHVVTVAVAVYHFPEVRLRRIDMFYVVPGMYNIGSFWDSSNQVRKVAQVYVHDEFPLPKSDQFNYNIAVLKLNEPVIFNDLVRPICLWGDSESSDLIVGHTGVAAGWGIQRGFATTLPTSVTITILDKKECSQKLYVPPSTRLFCGTSQGALPCYSDFGSGLAIKRGTRFYLRGIFSSNQFDLTRQQCDPKKYVQYVDVAAFRDWLIDVIQK